MKNELKNQIIYQVFARNFTKEGTFCAFNEHINYIKNLGADIVYFTPINEIGLIDRKQRVVSENCDDPKEWFNGAVMTGGPLV